MMDHTQEITLDRPNEWIRQVKSNLKQIRFMFFFYVETIFFINIVGKAVVGC
jgi:hypothetical protein